MPSAQWTDDENDLIVEDYFAMLGKDVSGQPYSKSAHRRGLRARLNARTDGSIEFKHQNISAVLQTIGEPWIFGYKPASNFQTSLIDAVIRWLKRHPDWLEDATSERDTGALLEASELYIAPPPTLSNHPPPLDIEKMQFIARKFDVAGRDERNRRLGKAGEKYVFDYERFSLKRLGRDDLSEKVRWVAEEDGDGAGYDIRSYHPSGESKFIEMKTTNGWERTPFHISHNELAASEHYRDEWRILRLWNFAREPKAFELQSPLDRHVSLMATNFRASFDPN
ncbi:DUF3883 domain-containing protein [Paracoccaceae bacterium GXU_MW_L88]